MTKKEREKLRHDVAIEVFNADFVQLPFEDCYKINGEYWNQSVWLPDTDEAIFRMVKDKLNELGFGFGETIKPTLLGGNVIRFEVTRSGPGGIIYTWHEEEGEDGSCTIQELGCIAALEAVRKLNKNDYEKTTDNTKE